MNPSVGDIIGDKSRGFVENFSMAYLKKINYELCYSYNIGIVIEIFFERICGHLSLLLRFLFYFLETLSSRSLFTFYEASFYEPRKTSVSSSFDGNHRRGSRYKKKYISLSGTSSSWLKKSR